MIEPPYGKPWLLYALLAGSITTNVLLVGKLRGQATPENTVAAATAASVAPVAAPALVPQPTAAADANPDQAQAGQAQAGQAQADQAQAAPLDNKRKRVSAGVSHSLARTFQRVTPDDGDALSAVFARLFMWDLDLRRDLQAGDEVAAIYNGAGESLTIEAARLVSRKHGGALTAYQWTAAGDSTPSYWTREGREVPARLEPSPIAAYEQITALLKDRPTHKGMDFKAPVGVPVVSPVAGKVTRTNWNRRANGNCVEVRYQDGTEAIFLHLSEVLVRPGQAVNIGTRIGRVGNTGRSTAPHLHYQLERSGRTIDPIEYHETTHRSLSADEMAAFKAHVADLENALDEAVALR